MIESVIGIIAVLGGGLLFVLRRLRSAKQENESLKDKIEVKEKTDEVVDQIRDAADEPPVDGYAVDRVLASRKRKRPRDGG